MNQLLTTKNNTVDAHEFRQLLTELSEHRADTGIRIRMMGELWQNEHLHILKLTAIGVALIDVAQNRITMIEDLRAVMQFELDQPFKQFQPNFHYNIALE